MAEDKGVEVVGTEIAAKDLNAKQTYYLKEGKEHSFYKDGILHTLDEVNAEAELTEDGYESFKDKFSEEPTKIVAPTAEDAKTAKPSEKSTELVDSPASDKPNAGTPVPAPAKSK